MYTFKYFIYTYIIDLISKLLNLQHSIIYVYDYYDDGTKYSAFVIDHGGWN